MSLSPKIDPLPYMLSGSYCFLHRHFWLSVIELQFAGFVGGWDCGVEPPRVDTGIHKCSTLFLFHFLLQDENRFVLK